MNHHLRWPIAAAALVVGVAAVAQHLQIFAGTASTEVSSEEVQQRYNAATSATTDTATSAPNSADPTPVPGVYVYRTTGRDSVDALQGAHHDYPATTTITITPTACGVTERWDVLDQRWEEWHRCATDGGISETARTSHDEFFGQSQTDAWTCVGASRPIAAAGSTGATWATTCTSGTTVEVHDGVVIGADTIEVGTVAVATLHVRVTISDATASDTQTIDTWYLQDSDLVVAQTAASATTNSSPIGDVHYVEAYEIRLTSLTPLT